MVEAVQVETPEEVSVSYDDDFDSMWKDSDKGPNLDAVPVPSEDDNSEVGEEPAVAVEDELPPEPGVPAGEEVPAAPEAAPETQTPSPRVAPRDPYSWIESLPEEQREMAERLKHTALSDRGRVSALTRKLDETNTELARARSAQVAPAPEDVSAPNAQQLPESIQKLQEDYPELGKQLVDIFNDREAALKQEISAQIDPIKEARDADARAADQALIEREAAEIFKTEETGTYWKDVVRSEDFTNWLDTQPTFIQNTARTSNDPQDGIDVLRLYENDYQAALAAQEAPSTNDAAETPTTRGDALKAQRQQRQATTVSPGSKPASVDTDEITGDYDSQFNAMWGGGKK